MMAVDDELSAQQAYSTMLRDHIGLAIRASGFKGSKGSYQMRRDEWVVWVEFQRSKWSTRESVQFDLNVGVSHPLTQTLFVEANREAASLGKEAEEPPAGSYWNRLSLLCEREQFGWEVTPTAPVEPVALDVMTCLRDRFLPIAYSEIQKPLSAPTPPKQRPDRLSRAEANEAALTWHLEALRQAGVTNLRREK